MTKTGHEIASYYWISRKTPTKNTVWENIENINIHCEKRHIVESCEINATVAPSAGWSADPLCYVLCILFIYASSG